MDRHKDNYKLFTRRALIMGGVKTGLLGVLGARLAYLQVFQQNKYKTLADDNRINLKLLEPLRGHIYDRFDVPVAINTQNFRLNIIAEQAQNVEETLYKLARTIPLTEQDIQRVLNDVKARRSFVPVTILNTLNWEQLAAVEVSLPELPGIVIEEGQIRSYPLIESAAHLVGYVGAVSESELGDDPVLSLPGFRIGKTGVEKKHELILRGTAGTAQIEVNALGRQVRELQRQEGQKGDDITLTIDAELQHNIQKRLARERSAAAVVMDTQTGAVYAMNSHPSFDPNLFIHGISAEVWEEYLANAANPLTNKAIAGQYPPGSTFKMVTALAGLQTGIIKPGRTAFCPGHMDLGDHRFHCWKRGGHGHVGFTQALAQSCDVFFYEIAKDIGIENIAEMSRKLGLGDELGIDIPGERGGLIPDKDWKRGRFGSPWQLGETVVASIGQGYILTTPLQLATMTARLVNGGKAVKPYVVEKVGGWRRQHKEPESLGIDDKYLTMVRRGMEMAVMSTKGTAFASRIKQAEMAMAGKTGTAQVRRISMEDRIRGMKMEELPWDQQHHALFVGYAPYDNPRYAAAVVVEHGGGGSSVAAPIAHDILLKTQERAPHLRQIRLFKDADDKDAKASSNKDGEI